MFNQSAFSLSLGHDWLIIQHRIERIQHYSSSNTSQIIWIELQKTKLLFLSNGSQRWLTLWLVVSAECFRMSAHAFKTSSLQFLNHILYHNHYLPHHWKAVQHKSPSYSSVAAVDLDSSQSFPLGSFSFQQWVISSAESEKGERGRGERERVVHSGFKAPMPRPLSSLSWQFPPSTWPVSTLKPSRSVWDFGCSHTCHLSAVFVDHECLILLRFCALGLNIFCSASPVALFT